MSYYLRECPNCKSRFGTAVKQCPYCGQVLERSAPLPPLVSMPRTPTQAETDTGQSILAYRLAAVVLYLAVLVNVVSIVFAIAVGDPPPANLIVSSIIDSALGVGLLLLKRGARSLVLIRAVLGGIFLPILTFAQGDVVVAIVTTVMQWGYCGSLILLLTGESKTWRIVVGMAIFCVFSLCLGGGLMAVGVLALLL
jgi:hypothetical protein